MTEKGKDLIGGIPKHIGVAVLDVGADVLVTTEHLGADLAAEATLTLHVDLLGQQLIANCVEKARQREV